LGGVRNREINKEGGWFWRETRKREKVVAFVPMDGFGVDATTPLRSHKTHSALEARIRGSPAWKLRLQKRALNRVEQLRRDLLGATRGAHANCTTMGNGAANATKFQMKSIINAEVDAMDLEGAEGLDVTLSGDLPPLSDQEYEDLMIAMCEELYREEGVNLSFKLFLLM
jgi:hypothetical protein